MSTNDAVLDADTIRQLALLDEADARARKNRPQAEVDAERARQEMEAIAGEERAYARSLQGIYG